VGSENIVTLDDIGSIFEKKNKPILDFLNELQSKKIDLAEKVEKPAAEKPAEKNLVPAGDKVDLEESLDNIKIMEVPVVPVAGGMFVSVLATEVIDGFLIESSNTTKGVVKLIAAGGAFWAGKKWGRKVPLLGSTGLKTIALLVGFDGVRSLTPLDSWAEKLANKITGKTPSEGLASHKDELERLRAEYQASQQGRNQIPDRQSITISDKIFGGRR
jgi:hypothetical protein